MLSKQRSTSTHQLCDRFEENFVFLGLPFYFLENGLDRNAEFAERPCLLSQPNRGAVCRPTSECTTTKKQTFGDPLCSL